LFNPQIRMSADPHFTTIHAKVYSQNYGLIKTTDNGKCKGR